MTEVSMVVVGDVIASPTLAGSSSLISLNVTSPYTFLKPANPNVASVVAKSFGAARVKMSAPRAMSLRLTSDPVVETAALQAMTDLSSASDAAPICSESGRIWPIRLL